MSVTQQTQKDNTIGRFNVSVKRFLSKTETDEAGNPAVDHWEAWLHHNQIPNGLIDNDLLDGVVPENDGTWLTFRGDTENDVRLAVKQYLELYSAEHSKLDASYVDTKMRRTWKMRTYKLEEPRETESDGAVHALFDDDDDDW